MAHLFLSWFREVPKFASSGGTSKNRDGLFGCHPYQHRPGRPVANRDNSAAQDCWLETEQGAKSVFLDKRAKLVDKCVKDKMSGAK
jgi:hypothetical protein